MSDIINGAGVVVAAVALVIPVLLWRWSQHHDRRQLEANEQQARTSLLQALNSYDFELHRMFLQYPHLRPYFYNEDRQPVDSLPFEDQQRLKCIVGYVLDYFHLIASTTARFPDRVPKGYLEFMKDWLSTNPLLTEYLEQHKAWANWYLLLKAVAEGREIPTEEELQKNASRVAAPQAG